MSQGESSDTNYMLDRQVTRMVEVLEDDIVPLTEKGVAAGNKVFGAAVIERHSLELVVAATNSETANPLFHGEITALNDYWALEARPDPGDCLFLSTHEPCSLCLSAITWSGFDNFFYLFSYEDSRDSFAIPHDLKIMGEVFGLPDGEYNRSNEFWTCYHLTEVARCLPQQRRDDFESRVEALRVRYSKMSGTYQADKGKADIPLA